MGTNQYVEFKFFGVLFCFSQSLVELKLLIVNKFVQVMKNLRDIQGPALAIVLERLKPNGAFHGTV